MGTLIEALIGKVTSFAIPPWVKIVAVAMVVVAIYGAGFWTSSTLAHADNEKAAVKALKDQRAADAKIIVGHNDQQKVDQGESDSTAKERDRLAKQVSELQRALALAKLLQSTPQQVTINEAGEKSCPNVDVRSDGYRLCVNAAITGSDAGLAACEAEGGHATL